MEDQAVAMVPYGGSTLIPNTAIKILDSTFTNHMFISDELILLMVQILSFQCIRETTLWSPVLHHQSTMGQTISQLKLFQNSFKHGPPSHPSDDLNTSLRPSIFSTLRKPPVAKPNNFIPLFSDCISTASSRTQEYLLFKDPEGKFHPSLEVLTQVGNFILIHALELPQNCF